MRRPQRWQVDSLTPLSKTMKMPLKYHQHTTTRGSSHASLQKDLALVRPRLPKGWVYKEQEVSAKVKTEVVDPAQYQILATPLMLRSVDRSVRLGRLGVCPECRWRKSARELDYNEVRTTERWINTQGESACQALKGKGRKGLYKVFQPKRMRCRDSTKYAQRGCIGKLQRLYKVYN
jgi:hypothetical protein